MEVGIMDLGGSERASVSRGDRISPWMESVVPVASSWFVLILIEQRLKSLLNQSLL
ncbi:proteinaceous RNase p 2 [Phtheirospermum japonicum]|uniref:Proteinaceous RNase p 2 n=1 Tax=Phtheirospermum japonicum TaxID=374723 RepID=A0A830C2R4_9LAMI|nr:proteinaceous RNase p 2 [Phtheirospermum japonicum]